MNKKIGTAGAVAALLIGGAVNVHSAALPGVIEIPAGNAGYVNADGEAVRTGRGECLKLDGFSEENQVNACEGIDDAAEAAAQAEADAAAAEAEAKAAAEAEARAAAEAAAAPAPEPVTKEPIVTTENLDGKALFDSNSAELNAASEQALAQLVAKLATYQEISAMEVVGHSDSTGDDNYNQQLSEQRAQAVEQFLKAAYPDVTITSRGMGESTPIATNSTREGRQANRRVEILITAKSVTE